MASRHLVIGALAWLLGVCPGAASAQVSPDAVVEPSSGVRFPVALTPPGGSRSHRLTGTAIRRRTVFRLKIYAFGLYVDAAGARAALASFGGRPAPALQRDERVFDRLLDLEFAMTLRLVMTRTVDGTDIAEAFDDALRPRLVRAVAASASAVELRVLETFADSFDVPEMRTGTELVFSCDPAGRLTTSIAGTVRAPLESRLLCRALFDVYLGDDPISDDGKRALVAGLPGLLTPAP